MQLAHHFFKKEADGPFYNFYELISIHGADEPAIIVRRRARP